MRLAGWLVEGARALVFLRPRWDRLPAGPALLLVLAILNLLLNVAAQRVEIGAGAVFDPSGLSENLLLLVPLAWASYAARARGDGAPTAAQMLALLMAQFTLMAIVGCVHYTAIMRSDAVNRLDPTALGLLWYVPMFWLLVAVAVQLWRAAAGPAARAAALGAVCAGVAALIMLDSDSWLWRQPEAQAEPTGFTLAPEALEEQLPLLGEQLDALKPQRPGIVDMYTIVFAPYEGEEVFRRESEMVDSVMAARFDAAGRGLQLLNHRETIATRPWATPLNLARAIEGVAEVMDPNEDILFIHLTSHGAANGQLAGQFDPLEMSPVVPADLRRWLDEAHIRYRVLSISACYSGSWVKPLAGDGTLVMTASDADHTSYGCGSRSDLTFFGRAMYDEQLRKTTLSFEEAHASARPIILQRETAAGKDDGYSNPQIAVGAAIRQQLARQRARLAASGG